MDSHFEMVLATGKVRDLQCNYDTLSKRALSCKWREPQKVFTPIKAYIVNVIRNRSVVQRSSTKSLKFESGVKLRLGKNYAVSVKMMTDTEGPIAVTRVNFTNSGMIIPPLFVAKSNAQFPHNSYIISFYV